MQSTQQQDTGQVRIVRTYRVAPEKIWRAWTEPQALSQWFAPGKNLDSTEAEIDLRVGGRYRIAFQAPNGETHEASGVYEVVEPNKRLVFSWGWKGTPERISRISIELKSVSQGTEQGTELNFVHDRFFDTAARDNHERGWQSFFVNLGDFLQAEPV